MFLRSLLIVTLLSVLVSACAPVQPTQKDSNSAIKDELAPILKAMLRGSIKDQPALVEYTKTACANVEGLGAPPRCPEGITEGTTIQVFPVLGPEGSFVEPAEMEQLLTGSEVTRLYAVYRVTPNPNLESYYPQGEYGMLFERGANKGQEPITLRVAGGKIVRMDFHIGSSAPDLLKQIPTEQIIVSPHEADAWAQAVK